MMHESFEIEFDEPWGESSTDKMLEEEYVNISLNPKQMEYIKQCLLNSALDAECIINFDKLIELK